MTDSTPPSGQVSFSYQDWLAAYPAFAGHVSAGQAEGFFQLAELILNNTDSSPVRNMKKRRTLLWLLVAHQAQLSASDATASASDPAAGSPAAPPVGRISSATQGLSPLRWMAALYPVRPGGSARHNMG